MELELTHQNATWLGWKLGRAYFWLDDLMQKGAIAGATCIIY